MMNLLTYRVFLAGVPKIGLLKNGSDESVFWSFLEVSRLVFDLASDYSWYA
jgi:hypothetical protein